MGASRERRRQHPGPNSVRSWHVPAEKALRPQQQDEQHWKEENEIRKLRQQRLTEIVDEAHDDAADKGAKQAAGAAENDDDQRERQHVLIKARIDRQDRSADDAGKSCKTRAEGKDDREQLRHEIG